MRIKDVHEKEVRKKIEKAYGFSVKSMKYTPLGEISVSYIVKLKNRKVFVQVGNPEFVSKNKLKEVLRFLYFLVHKHGIKNISNPIKNNNGNLITDYKRFPIVVYEFIEGKHPKPKEVSDLNPKVMAQIIAKIHKINPKNFNLANESTDLKWEGRIDEFIDKAKKSNKKDLKKLIIGKEDLLISTFEKVKELVIYVKKRKEGRVICHGDLHEGNLLVNNKGIFIIDWDEVAKSLPERDIVWFYKNKTFLSEYKKNIKGYKIDKKAIEYYKKHMWIRDITYFIKKLLRDDLTKVERKLGLNLIKEGIKDLERLNSKFYRKSFL